MKPRPHDTTKPYYNCAGGLIGTAHSYIGNAAGGGSTNCALPVSLCYNTGDVTAKEANGRAAGITGLRVGYKSTDTNSGAYNPASQIGNCFSTGKVEGETAAAISTAFVLQADNEANYYVDHFAEGVSIQDAKLREKGKRRSCNRTAVWPISSTRAIWSASVPLSLTRERSTRYFPPAVQYIN